MTASLRTRAHLCPSNTDRGLVAEEQHQRSSPEQVQALIDQLVGHVSQLDREMDAMRRRHGTELAAALLAHEVSNILTPGKALAQLALARPEDRELSQRALQRIVTSIDRTTEIANTVIEITEGQVNSGRDETEVLMAAREAIGSLGEDLSTLGITIELKVDPSLHVTMSSVALVQVLVNLVRNAIRSMQGAQRGTRICIEAQRAECSTWNTDAVRLAVVDDGPGIEPGLRERIFEPFVRTSESKRQGGKGLGLSICRQLVVAAGGEIEVSSTHGHGACFSILLPCGRMKRDQAA